MCSPLVDGGACFAPAPLPAARTQCGDVTEYCDTTGMTAANLDCLGKSGPAPGATPAKVTLTGFVHVFSSGPDSNDMKVQVFDAANVTAANPAAAQTLGSALALLDPTTQRACDADAAKGCSIPLAQGCALPTCNDGLDGHADDGKYCRDNGAGGECSDRLRWESRYAIPSIPTNTALVIRVTSGSGMSDSTWATTVAFNVFLSTNDRACTSSSDTDCLDLSDPPTRSTSSTSARCRRPTTSNIPTISGLSGGISSGKGAIAGEVHDCDNVRVANVEVATTPAADRFTYFNGNPIMTLPDSARAAVGTDWLGLFAALNVDARAGARRDRGGDGARRARSASFGTVDAFVYANTVSIVNINGGSGRGSRLTPARRRQSSPRRRAASGV